MRPVRIVGNLERARNLSGLSREELAHKSGVSERTIRRLEESRKTPRVPTQRCLAAALKMPTSTLWPSGVDHAALERRAA